MWKRSHATVGERTEETMVDFAPHDPRDKPIATVLEWPDRLELNTEVQVGEDSYFTRLPQPIAGQFHHALHAKPVEPKPAQASADAEPETSTAPAPTKKKGR